MATRHTPDASDGVVDELAVLLDLLPASWQQAAKRLDPALLLEIVLDLGRAPEARLTTGPVVLTAERVTPEQLAALVARIGHFDADHRAGLERTLHRLSAIFNRRGEVVGLTLRVGRAITGTIEVIRDLVEDGRNLLLLGRPGVGKTTKLRELARVLSSELHRRVMIIDTSNEIGGDGDVPHPAIGSSRRMQVPHPDRQHAVMIEAVENHTPEVIIVDEIGTEAEAAAARTIAERGVQLVGTAHGNTLENLVLNPTLSDLVGGVHTVTLGDEEARRRGTPKTVRERRAPPTFDTIVEMLDRDEVVVHKSTADAVDRLLGGDDVRGERRRVDPGGTLQTEEVRREPLPAARTASTRPRGTVKIHPYALSRDLLDRVIRDLRLDAKIVAQPNDADLVVTLRSRIDDPRLRRLAEAGVPVHAVKRNSSAQLNRLLQSLLGVPYGADDDEVRDAIREVEGAIERVMSERVPVELAPRPPVLRKLQHRLVTRFHLEAESVGSEPSRHLVLYPQ